MPRVLSSDKFNKRNRSVHLGTVVNINFSQTCAVLKEIYGSVIIDEYIAEGFCLQDMLDEAYTQGDVPWRFRIDVM